MKFKRSVKLTGKLDNFNYSKGFIVEAHRLRSIFISDFWGQLQHPLRTVIVSPRRSFSPQWEERVLPVDDVARVFNLHQRARALPLQNSVHTHTHTAITKHYF